MARFTGKPVGWGWRWQEIFSREKWGGFRVAQVSRSFHSSLSSFQVWVLDLGRGVATTVVCDQISEEDFHATHRGLIADYEHLIAKSPTLSTTQAGYVCDSERPAECFSACRQGREDYLVHLCLRSCSPTQIIHTLTIASPLSPPTLTCEHTMASIKVPALLLRSAEGAGACFFFLLSQSHRYVSIHVRVDH
jgi:hypothetical protein